MHLKVFCRVQNTICFNVEEEEMRITKMIVRVISPFNSCGIFPIYQRVSGERERTENPVICTEHKYVSGTVLCPGTEQ